MISLTINKTDLKRQLAAELVEIRDGDPDAVATALVFTRDDRYSIAVRVTPARSGYSVNVRTFLGGEAAEGNTTLIHTVETTCAYILEVLDFVVTCAACADLDAEKAKKDNATALAHLDAKTAKTDAAPVGEKARQLFVKTAARNAAAELEMIADTYGVHAARACITNLGARLEADGHCLVSLRLQDIKGQSTSRYRDSVRACAAALREIAGPVEAAPVDPAGREFYVATISGVEGNQVVVDTVRAESEEAAAKVVADRVYGGDFYRGGGFYFGRGGVLTCWIATGDSDVCAPITVHAVDHELAAPMAPVRTALVCAMGDRARPTRMKPSELLAIAQARRADTAQPDAWTMTAVYPDNMRPWTVIAVYPDNGQIHGEHVLARDGAHALALVAAAMCESENDEDGVVDCDLICAIAGHLAEPNIEYAGADVVSAAQYLENHGAE